MPYLPRVKTLLCQCTLWNKKKSYFSLTAISKNWKFAGGLFLTTLLAMMLTQIDKVILSKFLSLEEFGIYTLAATVAGVLFQLIGPIAQSYFPKLTQLWILNKESELKAMYHQGAQLMSIVLVPAGLMLIFFSEQILYAWTGDSHLAHKSSLLVAILATGTILNGLMHLPYMLQLASGWSMLAVKINLVAVIILVPVISWITPQYGSIGAACIWVVINAGYLVFGIHFMHLRLLPLEKKKWYIWDLLIPSFSAMVVVLISYFIHPQLDRLLDILWILITGILTLFITFITCNSFKNFREKTKSKIRFYFHQ